MQKMNVKDCMNSIENVSQLKLAETSMCSIATNGTISSICGQER